MFDFKSELNGNPASGHFENCIKWIIVITATKLIFFALLQMYNSLWRYISVEELIQVFFFSGTIGFFSILYVFQVPMPRSVVIISGIFDLLLLGIVRMGYRSVRIIKESKRRILKQSGNQETIIIFGAGKADAAIAKDTNRNAANNGVVGFIDDDSSKDRQRIHGIPILGNRNVLIKHVNRLKVSEIIIAIPSCEKKKLREILDICSVMNCKLKILPSLGEIIDGQVSISDIRM